MDDDKEQDRRQQGSSQGKKQRLGKCTKERLQVPTPASSLSISMGDDGSLCSGITVSMTTLFRDEKAPPDLRMRI